MEHNWVLQAAVEAAVLVEAAVRVDSHAVEDEAVADTVEAVAAVVVGDGVAEGAVAVVEQACPRHKPLGQRAAAVDD